MNKIHQSETLNNTSEMSETDQKQEINSNKGNKISKPLQTMMDEIPKLSAVVLDI